MSNSHWTTGQLEKTAQYCHEHGEPELLCAEQTISVGSPLPEFDIVDISQDHEDPGSLVSVSTSLKFWVVCTFRKA